VSVSSFGDRQALAGVVFNFHVSATAHDLGVFRQGHRQRAGQTALAQRLFQLEAMEASRRHNNLVRMARRELKMRQETRNRYD